MISSKEISVVVQEAIDKKQTPICLKSIRKYLPNAEIILSTWEDSNVKNLDGLYDILVLNKDPGAYYCNRKKSIKNNLNRQIVSTTNGLKKAKRHYVLKLRSDLILTSNKFLDYYDMFPNRNSKYSLYKQRIIVSSLFSREFCYSIEENRNCYCKCFVSDWYFFGLLEDIKLFFDVSLVKEPEFSEYYINDLSKLDYIWKDAPEGYFSKHFLAILCKQLNLTFDKINRNLSNEILASNYIFLGYRESGIYNEKYEPFSKDERLFDYIQYPGLITYYKFLKFYKKYLNSKYLISDDIKNYYKLRKNQKLPISKTLVSFVLNKVKRG